MIESKAELWRIDSIVPPPMGSKGMELWKKKGRAVPWEHL